MDNELSRLVNRLERAVRELRAYAERTGALLPSDAADEWPEARDRAERARRLRDKTFRERSGALLYEVFKAGKRMKMLELMILGVGKFRYDGRGISGFFRGKPPALRREGDDVVLTKRGEAAARFWLEHFGPRAGPDTE